MTQIEAKQNEIAALKAKIEKAEQDRNTMKLNHAAAIKASIEQTVLDKKILKLHEAQLELLNGLEK